MAKTNPWNFVQDFNQSKLNEGVYIHSVPPNSELYDLLWSWQSTEQLSGWGLDRHKKLRKFLGKALPSIRRGNVLDVCCGLGRFSIASLELGFQQVVACDGSLASLRFLSDLARTGVPGKKAFADLSKRLGFYKTFSDRMAIIQLDTERITECIKPESFDLVIHHMALHHTRDFRKTLSDISSLLANEGTLAFNFFTPGTIPPVLTELRNIFISQNVQGVYDFLVWIAKLPHGDSTAPFDFNKYLSTPGSQFEEYRKAILPLTSHYPIDAIYQNLHFESLTTPYLHNFEIQEIEGFVRENLKLKIIDMQPDRICARKSLD